MQGLNTRTLNGGLAAMCIISLLPVGLLQTWASVDRGYWYARSTEFLGRDAVQVFRWLRVPGDTIFFVGSIALIIFVYGLRSGSSFVADPDDPILDEPDTATIEETDEVEDARELVTTQR